MDQLPRLRKRELICSLLFTCNYVVSVWRGFHFLWVLGMGYVVLLWHSLSLSYNYFTYAVVRQFSRGDERIREDIPVPDSLGKEAFLIGVFTSRGNLKGH